jgi:hypothetical protein
LEREKDLRSDVFNSSSFAAQDIAEMIQKSRKNESLKRRYKAGQITLEEVNAKRSLLGLPPLSAGYMKKLRFQTPSLVAKPTVLESTTEDLTKSSLKPRANTKDRIIKPKGVKKRKLTAGQIFYDEVKRLQDLKSTRDIHAVGAYSYLDRRVSPNIYVPDD